MKRDVAAQRILSAMIVVLSCLILVPSLNAAGQDPLQVARLLSQARQEAIRLREDTNQMRDFALIDVTWETHGVYADMIRDDIRAMQQKAELLDESRGCSLESQKSVIDQIDPLINELVATTNEVYEAIGQRTSDRVRYTGYLEANYDHAERLARLLSDSFRRSLIASKKHKGNSKLMFH